MIRGRYDAQAEKVIEETNAELVILVVIGPRGPGLSVSLRPSGLPMLAAVPDMLLEVAEAIRKDVKDMHLYPARKP